MHSRERKTPNAISHFIDLLMDMDSGMLDIISLAAVTRRSCTMATHCQLCPLIVEPVAAKIQREVQLEAMTRSSLFS